MNKTLAEIFRNEINAARDDGFNVGFKIGSETERIRIVSAKLRKGKTTEEIADSLELEETEVQLLIKIIKPKVNCNSK